VGMGEGDIGQDQETAKQRHARMTGRERRRARESGAEDVRGDPEADDLSWHGWTLG